MVREQNTYTHLFTLSESISERQSELASVSVLLPGHMDDWVNFTLSGPLMMATYVTEMSGNNN
jgi:hypothetical protein